MANLEGMAGGSINRWGGVDGAVYRPTGFSISNDGTIRDGYNPVARVDRAGDIRTGYNELTNLRVSNGSIRQY